MKTEETKFFQIFWKKGPNHLPFLSLSEDKPHEFTLERSLNLLSTVRKELSKEEIVDSLNVFFDDRNWRPQLVGALFLVSADKELIEHFIPKLWKCLELNSWASYQLISIVYLLDTNFEKSYSVYKSVDDPRRPDLFNFSPKDIRSNSYIAKILHLQEKGTL